MLAIGPDIPVVTRELATHGKPDPDLFLVAAERLNVNITRFVIIGTVYGTYLQLVALRRWALAFSAVDRVRTNLFVRAHIGFIKTLPTCCSTPEKSAFERKRDECRTRETIREDTEVLTA